MMILLVVKLEIYMVTIDALSCRKKTSSSSEFSKRDCGGGFTPPILSGAIGG